MPIKPGTVHFEFGNHATEDEARQKLRSHLSGSDVPDHIIIETPPSDFKLRTEAESIRDARDTEEFNRKVAAQLSQGENPYTKAYQKTSPYNYKRASLIASANNPNARVNVHIEPFNENIVRQTSQIAILYRVVAKHVAGGNVGSAFAASKEASEKLADANHAREQGIVGIIEGILQREPRAKILCEMGGAHDHLVEVLKARGIEATFRKTSVQLTHKHLHVEKLLLLAKHGLEQPTQGQIEQVSRRGFVISLLKLGNFSQDQADRAAERLTAAELNELYASLEAPGGNLSKRARQWLTDRKKL